MLSTSWTLACVLAAAAAVLVQSAPEGHLPRRGRGGAGRGMIDDDDDDSLRRPYNGMHYQLQNEDDEQPAGHARRRGGRALVSDSDDDDGDDDGDVGLPRRGGRSFTGVKQEGMSKRQAASFERWRVHEQQRRRAAHLLHEQAKVQVYASARTTTLDMNDCPNRCSMRGTCVDGDCLCNYPWSGMDCRDIIGACVDDCSSNGVCADGECVCDSGWEGIDCATPSRCPENCNGHGVCIGQQCECDLHYGGESCGVFSGQCPNDCWARGRCEGDKCYCDPGWQGLDCSMKVGCPRNCSSHGKCDNGKCDCDDEWTGEDCSVRKPTPCPNNCTSLEHGICTRTGECVCKNNHNGVDCSKTMCPKDCNGHGNCNDMTGTCECQEGWTRDDCTYAPCPGTPECTNHGVCVSGTCNCDRPWGAIDCSVMLCPPWPGNNCSGHGTCDDHTGRCDCAYPWITEDCSEAMCPRACSNHGQCDRTTGTCSCNPPWVGEDCGTPLCPRNCSGHGRCNMKGQCECNFPWTSRDCSLAVCPNDCSQRGTCDDMGVCHCDDPFIGADCSGAKCPGDCSGHGVCSNQTGACVCDQTYILPDCKSKECPGVPSCTGHGTCDGASGDCTCMDEWYGPTCSTQYQECPSNCSQHGVCDRLTGGCDCDGDGDTAYQQPDCSLRGCPNMCSGHGNCDGQTGECNCDVGWRDMSCSSAICPKMCSGHGDCNTNTGQCTCDAPWSSDACDVASCPGTPECTGHGTCDTTKGACSCQTAWYGVDCSVRNCPMMCNQRGDCDNTTGTCSCQSPWYGDGCEFKQCPGTPECTGNGDCNNTVGECTCDDGYEGSACATATTATTTISPSPSASTEPSVLPAASIDTSASVVSISAAASILPPVVPPPSTAPTPSPQPIACDPVCVHGVCADGQCECVEDFYGPACDQVEMTPPEPRCGGAAMGCSGHGTCVRGVCRCNAPWYDVDCNSFKCHLDCSGRGTCVKGVGCDCIADYTGQGCESSTTPPPVDCSPPCERGTCSDGVCVCPPGWSGPTCSNHLCDPPCLRGTCTNGQCVCPAGWGGPSCSDQLCDPPCERGTCTNGQCACPAGWSGPTCDQKLCNPPCDRGECVDGACVCPAGWGGVTCTDQLCDPPCERGTCTNGQCACPAGWSGPTCDQKLCNPPCDRGECVDGSCVCPAGWGGATCTEQLCQPPCARGECINGKCACPAGWGGPTCSDCDPACERGDCVDGQCVCPAGWAGPTCDEQLCDPPCERGTCTNGQCACPAGWSGPTCDQKLCNPPCDRGECVDGTCVCPAGWGGSTCSDALCDPPCSNGANCGSDGLCICSAANYGPGCVSTHCPGWVSEANVLYAYTGKAAAQFSFDATLRTYADSAAHCAAKGAVIASIHNDDENAQVLGMILSSAYVGARSNGQGMWSWADGTSWDYSPSNPSGTNIYLAISEDGSWTDGGGGAVKRGVVCRVNMEGSGPYLTLNPNDRIKVLEEGETGDWSKGELNGMTGYFPTDYVTIDDTTYVECNNNGDCANNTGTCKCYGGFRGPDCSDQVPTCPGPPSPAPSCNGNGKCKEGVCECTSGWGGDACQYAACEPDPDCGSHGECLAAVCVCDDGWKGADCTTPISKPCPKNCSGNGVCDGVSGMCECNNFTTGPACTKLRCPSNCSSNGNCEVQDDQSGKCICAPGWGESDCSKRVTCPGNCSGHGICNRDGGVCECNIWEEPYASPGGAPVVPPPPPSNHTWGGEDCAQPMCADNCSNHGVCGEAPATLQPVCICDYGWGGSSCETYMSCPFFCSGKGLCDEHMGVCRCSKGFDDSDDCSSPTYTDRCMTNCSGHGLCVDGKCQCEMGYGEYDCSVRDSKCPNICSGRGRCVPPGFGANFSYDSTERVYSMAVDYCNSINATIASVHSEMENDDILRIVTKSAYLGATSDNKGNWKWEDGTPWDFTPAAKHTLLGVTESRIALQMGEGDGYDGLWHDWLNGEARLGVVCRAAALHSHCRCMDPYVGESCDMVPTSDDTLARLTGTESSAATTIKGCPADCSEHGSCMDDGTCACWGVQNDIVPWWVAGDTGDCSQFACPFNCSWPNGQCQRLEDGVEIGCMCNPNHIGKHCEHDKECRCDPDHTHNCDCSTDYVDDDGATVCGCECEPGWEGNDCSTRKPCSKGDTDFECSKNGACWMGTCICDAGWTDDACGTKWYALGLTQCEGGDDNECNGLLHGVCQNGMCECLPGWTGYACEIEVPTLCPNLCSGHGICVEGRCECEKWWYGPDCSQSAHHVTHEGTYKCDSLFNCSGNGYCRGVTCPWPKDPPSGIARCACHEGFAGATCGARWPVCRNRCSGHGRCVADGECDCMTGYSGTDCSLEHPNLPPTRLECADDCNGRGVCDDMTGRCQCELNWEGSSCEFYVDVCLDHCSGAGMCEAGGLCRCAPPNEGESCSNMTGEVTPMDASETPLWDTMSLKPTDDAGRPLIPLDDTGNPVKVLFDASACPNNCSSRGLCTADGCICAENYAGQDCATVDLCTRNFCSGQGISMDGQCVCRWDVGGDQSLRNALPRGLLGNFYSQDEIEVMDPDEMRGVLRKAVPGVFTEAQLSAMSTEDLRDELTARVTTLPDKTSANPDMVASTEPTFFFSPEPRTYADSVSFCAANSATIASVHSDAEMAAAVEGLPVTAYLGARSDGAGTWRWEDGSPWDYTYTRNDGIEGVEETRLAYQVGMGDGYDDMWHDWKNGEALLGVICRVDPSKLGETPDCSIEPPGAVVDPICEADCHNCTGHGICMGNAVCMCHPEWRGSCCEQPNIPCSPVSDCNAPKGQCVLGVCQCASGYTGVSCEVDIEAEIKEKAHEEYVQGLRDGLGQNAKKCPNGCSNNGVCDPMTGKCTCACASRQADCSDCMRAIGQCLNNCSGHGVCVRGECHCYPGHVGEGCEIFEVPCPGWCSGQGLCLDGSCQCLHGYDGAGCEEGPTYRPCPRNCSGHGRCHEGRCHCPCGYHGDACEVTDGLCEHGCTGRGSCSLRTSECACSPGFFGPDCSVFSVDPIRLDCVDDASTAGLGTLEPNESVDVICPPGCEMSGGTIFGGIAAYTAHSRICKAAFHASVLPTLGGLATVTIKHKTSFIGEARNGVTSESENEAGRAFVLSSPWQPDLGRDAVAINVTCDATGVGYRPMMLGYTLDMLCPPSCASDPVPVYGSQDAGGYADHSGICKSAVHAGVLDDAVGGLVVYKSFPRVETFQGVAANGVQSADLASYDERTFQFTATSAPEPRAGTAADLYSWWRGSNPQVATSFDPCPGNCSCKGTCKLEGPCLCDGGSYAPDCSVTPGSCAHINHCSGQGLCEVVECHCGDGYTGESCELPAYDVYCANNCTGHGQCVRGQCHCYVGWKGATCEELDIPCWPACNDNQTCTAGQCLCIPGYGGSDCSELGADMASMEAHACRTSATLASLLGTGPELADMVPGYDPEAPELCDARTVCMLNSIKATRERVYAAIDDKDTYSLPVAVALKELVDVCTENIYHYFDGFLTYNVRQLRDQLFNLARELVDLDPTVYNSEHVLVDEVARYWGHADNVKLMLRNADASGVEGAADLVSQIKAKRDAVAEAVAMSVAKLLNASATLDAGPHPLRTILTATHDSTLPSHTSDGALSLTARATAASWEYKSLTGMGEAPVEVECPAGATEPGKSGPVWGTGVYTDDSAICAAGVHAGMIDGPAGGSFQVMLVQGRPRYAGSAQNDVTSLDHGVWMRAFVVCPSGSEDMSSCSLGQELPDEAPTTALASTCGSAVTAKDLRLNDGASVTILCSSPCVLEGVVWGDGVYTDDSSICKAAVHAGVVTEAGGAVLATAQAGQATFPAATKNGVASAAYEGQWDTAFTVSKGSEAAKVAEGTISCLTTGKSNLLSSLREQESSVVICPAGCGSGQLRVWGTGVYTDDSKVCQAAVHDGVVGQQGGHVRVTVLPGLPLYRSSEKRGIRSMGFLAYSRSFSVAGVAEIPPGAGAVALLQIGLASSQQPAGQTVLAGSSHPWPAGADPDAGGAPPACVVEGILRLNVAFVQSFATDFGPALQKALAVAAGGDTLPAGAVRLPHVRAGPAAGTTLVDYQVAVNATGEAGAEFVFDAKPRVYAKAAAYCIAIGARIASVHSEEEHRRVVKLATTTSFLGARPDGGGGWVWDDGSMFDWSPAGVTPSPSDQKSRLAVEVGVDRPATGSTDWHAWRDLDGAERKLGVVCRRATFSATTLDRARGMAVTINENVEEGGVAEAMVAADLPGGTTVVHDRKAVATCPGAGGGAEGSVGARAEDALRAMAAQGFGDVSTPAMWTGFDEATIRLSNGMSVRELVEAVSAQTNLDELKRLIAQSPELDERDAVQYLVAASTVLSARGASEIPDRNLMYILRIRIKQAAIDMYRLDPSSIQNPRQLTPAALADAVSLPSTKADLRELAEQQPNLKKSVDVLIAAVNAYLAAQAHIVREVRVLAYEIRGTDETMVPDMTFPDGDRAAGIEQAKRLAADTEYVDYLEAHRNQMGITAPGTQHAVELLIIALRTLAGALPFNPVFYGDLQAQRIFTLDTVNQMRLLGETEPFVEGTFPMTTLKINKIYNDPDMELALRVVAKNSLASSSSLPVDRDLDDLSKEDMVAELVRLRRTGETDAQIAAKSMEELRSELRAASEVGGDAEAVARSHTTSQLALDCLMSNGALDELVKAALYYLTLSVDQLSSSEPRLVMAAGLGSETQLHCVFGPRVYPWIDRLSGGSALLTVGDLQKHMSDEDKAGRTLEKPMLGTILKSAAVGLANAADEETIRRGMQEPLAQLMELYVKSVAACPELSPAGGGTAVPPALAVLDFVQHGLTGPFAAASSESNTEVPVACRADVQTMNPPLASVQGLQGELEDLLLMIAVEVQSNVPAAVPQLQGITLDREQVVKLVCTTEIVAGLMRYLERVDTCSGAASFDSDPHGVMQTETDLLAFRLLNIITITMSSGLNVPCPGDTDDMSPSGQCSGNGICIAGACVCFEMFGGASCRDRRTQDEIFDDGYETGLRASMTNDQGSALSDVLGEAIQRITGCGDKVKLTTKELSALNPRCSDVWATGRLSPLEILDKLEASGWVDELRLCAAGDGASNVTAFRHLVPRLLLEGATLRREVEDFNAMIKQLLVTTVTMDCKVADYLQYDLQIESVPCHDRARTMSGLKKDDIGAVVATKGSLTNLQNLLRVQGTYDLKSNIDNLIEIVVVLIKLGPCVDSCNAHGDCVEAICVCDQGFKGVSCSQEVPLLPGQCLRNCSNRGDCVDGQCHCHEGWKGADCSVTGVCENGCSMHGDCIDGVCDCYRRWRGTDCSMPREICPDDYSCYQGTCVRSRCECFHGWTGDDCTIGDFYKDHPPYKDPYEDAEEAFMSAIEVDVRTGPTAPTVRWPTDGTFKQQLDHVVQHHAPILMYAVGVGLLGVLILAVAVLQHKRKDEYDAAKERLRNGRDGEELEGFGDDIHAMTSL